MKCPKCGFIYEGELSECPYCGNSGANNDFLSEKIVLNSQLSIKRATIFNIVAFNIFAIALFLDGILFRFTIGLTSIGFIFSFGFVLVFNIVTRKNKEVLSIYFRIDIFFFLLLLISYLTMGNWFILGNLRPLFGSVIAPIYFALSSVILVLLLLIYRPKIHILEFGLVFPFRVVLIAIIFSFCIAFMNGSADSFNNLFYVAQEYPWQNMELFNTFATISCCTSFAIVLVITLNFMFFSALFLLDKIHYTYGE